MRKFFGRKPKQRYLGVAWAEANTGNNVIDYTAKIGAHSCRVSVDILNGCIDTITAFLDEEFIGFYESLTEAERQLERRSGV